MCDVVEITHSAGITNDGNRVLQVRLGSLLELIEIYARLVADNFMKLCHTKSPI